MSLVTVDTLSFYDSLFDSSFLLSYKSASVVYERCSVHSPICSFISSCQSVPSFITRRVLDRDFLDRDTLAPEQR